MVELFILIIIVTLVVLAIRGGATAVLDGPLIIQRPGQYHITLAPQLARARTFIENIAEQFAESGYQADDVATQYFEVNDPDAIAQGKDRYLLAVAVRGGMLYFQAINPQPLLRDADSHLKTIREYSEAVLVRHPPGEHTDRQVAEALCRAVEGAARQLQIGIKKLQGTD